MRSRTELINKLKMSIIVIALLSIVFWLSSCSDDPGESPDSFVGEWEYSNDQLQDVFNIKRDGAAYTLSDLSVNQESWQFVSAEEIELGRSIGYLAIKSPSQVEAIVFINSSLKGVSSI